MKSIIICSLEQFKFSPSQNALSLFFLNYCKSLFSLHISVLLNFLCRNSGFLFFFRRTSFQESSGSVYYSIFDCQGSVRLCFSIGCLKQTLLRKAHPFGLWSVRDDFSDEKSFPVSSFRATACVY